MTKKIKISQWEMNKLKKFYEENSLWMSALMLEKLTTFFEKEGYEPEWLKRVKPLNLVGVV